MTKEKDQLDDLVAKRHDCYNNATQLMNSKAEKSEVLSVSESMSFLLIKFKKIKIDLLKLSSFL